MRAAPLMLTAALFAAQAAAAEPKIPMCAGLTIVTAVNEPRGDYEPIVTVDSVTPKSVGYTYASQTATVSGSLLNTRARRTILIEDLQSATLIVPWISPSSPITIPGSTSLRVSSAVFRALKTTGVADITLVDRQHIELRADRTVHPNIYDHAEKYRIRRVGEGPERMAMTVNGTRVDLPVIHARGSALGDTIELFILDDDDNPLSLGIRMSSGPRGPITMGQTVKISFRCDPASGVRNAATPVNPIEQALLTAGRADVYDLYFDFNSATLRQESEPTLREIADVLQ